MLLHYGTKIDDLRIIDQYVCLIFIVLYITVQLVLIIWLRRGYLLRQSLRQQDSDYHKRVVKLHYRNSISDKYTDFHEFFEENESENQSTLQSIDNKLKFYLENENEHV
jgi:hypothetical protein